MDNLKYFEILKLNSELKESVISQGQYSISVLSNVTLNQFKEILEFPLRKGGINANVEIGNYDNIVQDSLKHKNSNLVIIFWEVCNLIDGLHFKIDSYSENDFNLLLDRTKSEIDLVIRNLQSTQLVLFNKFTSACFSEFSIDDYKLDILKNLLNQHLETISQTNVKIVNLEKSLLNLGLENSIDFRYYYSSKALYTVNFYKMYAESILPFIKAANGKSKKALIFDCDNTLWKGVLGEDGADNIEMSKATKDGIIFNEIQNIALLLNKRGILIGICSKNNLQEVQEVIDSHSDMLIKNENITIKKINWVDKATNIDEIAKELNISLDSIVFIDDSSFEVNLVKEKLPEVTVLQVPKRLTDYPRMLRRNLNLFYNLSQTSEDLQKTEMYKQQAERKSFKNSFNTFEDFLTALKLNVKIEKDNRTLIPRMSQLTQKTNQFNLTTKRYTETEIQSFIDDDNMLIYTFSVSDKFGDNGVTGLCIININYSKATADIDSILMSCRIIGRNIEYAFMNFIIEELKGLNINKINAKYIKSFKNNQVKTFYNTCNFSVLTETENETTYLLNAQEFKLNQIKYINIEYNG
jgi:FkbH-like protein